MEEKDVLDSILDKIDALEEEEKELYRKMENKALRFLSVRMRTEKEVVVKLRSLFGDDTEEYIALILEKMKYYGYLNDAAFTKDYISYLMKNRPMGKEFLKQNLLQKGVSYSLAEEGISEIEDEAYQNMLLRLIDKKEKTYEADPQRLLRFLAGRGFSYEEIKQALNLKNMDILDNE